MKPRKVNKVLTKNEALAKAMNYCAYQERCEKEVRERLAVWEVNPGFITIILKELQEDKFLNEQRFARIFAESKFRQKKWGKLKIENELVKKGIDSKKIAKGLREIDGKEYENTLRKLISEKVKMLKVKSGSKSEDLNQFELSGKVASFVIGKGYEPELVWQLIKRLAN
ncbi:MAG: RecX family transcriptional regulator [Bacteroidetes bacterium]|nr:RecX family transcriptional regulator [Bacteroidota bacterium]